MADINYVIIEETGIVAINNTSLIQRCAAEAAQRVSRT